MRAALCGVAAVLCERSKLNRRFLESLVVLGLLISGATAHADQLTTSFLTDNGRTTSDVGHFFDITIGFNPLTVTSFDVNVVDTDSFTLSVYTRSGTSSGFEGSSMGWSLQSSTSALGAGVDSPSFVDIDDVFLPSQSTVGIYLFFSNNVGIRYNSGDIPASNSDLSLDFGSVGEGLFGGVFFTPRTWSGTIRYGVVPEPSTATLLGLGLVGMGVARQQRAKREVFPVR